MTPPDESRRRGVRIESRFSVELVGHEAGPRLRRGDISVTGVFFETDRSPGPPGTLERLRLGFDESDEVVETLAVLVRVSTVRDLWESKQTAGVAFEFLPENEETRAALRELVAKIARVELAREGVIDDMQLGAEVNAQRVVVESLESDGLVLETGFPVERGTRIRVRLTPPGGQEPIDVEGIVKSAQSEGGRFRVQVDLSAGAGSTAGGDLAHALEALVSGVVAPEVRSGVVDQTPHLEGSLERVAVTSLLQFMHMENMSGVLRVDGDDGKATIYVRTGQIWNVEGPDPDPRTSLKACIQWTTGRFAVDALDVEPERRLDQPTTALLIDLAREIDEERT